MGIRTDYLARQVERQFLGGQPVLSENKLDFSENNALASEVIQAIKIPAGALVKNVRVVILTKEGSTTTATVGDGDGANSWDASTNLNANPNVVTAGRPGTDAYATAGKYYASADTIDLTLSAHALDAAIVNVSAEYTVLEKI
jgi:hypothetical protein